MEVPKSKFFDFLICQVKELDDQLSDASDTALCFFKIVFSYFCKVLFSDFTDLYIKYYFRNVIDNLGLYPSK